MIVVDYGFIYLMLHGFPLCAIDVVKSISI
jgi:hypothetical protein